ncbi:MAG TPA: hypothetical protein P5556_06335 [Candidatus Gastranaerophilales bacterium]|nr:hypothetical protein [Candidatus Gastranaerophilales bacterium]
MFVSPFGAISTNSYPTQSLNGMNFYSNQSYGGGYSSYPPSSMPFSGGYSSYPPSSSPFSGGYSSYPSSSIPFGGGYSSYPSSSMPFGGGYDLFKQSYSPFNFGSSLNFNMPINFNTSNSLNFDISNIIGNTSSTQNNNQGTSDVSSLLDLLLNGSDSEDSGSGLDPGTFDPLPLNPIWGNSNIPYNWANVATGLYGNIHGMNAILGRYEADTMPPASVDPTAPGNTWIYTLFGNPHIPE